MKGNVNPFQPWRPAELDVPRPLHASRPWRPPEKKAGGVAEEVPLVEPLEQPARNAPPLRKKKRRPTSQAALNTPIEELRTDQKVVLGMFFALGLLALVGLAWLGGTHLPRVFAVLLAVAAGITVGVSRARHRTWLVRL